MRYFNSFDRRIEKAQTISINNNPILNIIKFLYQEHYLETDIIHIYLEKLIHNKFCSQKIKANID